MKNAQSKNCEDKNNVMLLSSYNANFANTAKYTGECEMIILSTEKFPFPFYIDSMDGTSADIFTLKSTLNQNLLAEINSTDFLLWKNLQLYTPALSITLPPSTTFSMNANNENFDIYVDSDIQRGIMASPSYSVTGDTIVSGNGDPLIYDVFNKRG
uniref:Uncharacterized protein n=1 Tax=Panagrolaimus superbus TaxID=310955 RepID=A0A914YWP1_9BILA